MIPGVRGTNLTHARSFNLRLMLQTIRAYGPLSRTEVAHRTGLTKQTISNLTAALRHADLISEEDVRRGGVGKPSVPLRLNPNGAFAIGIKLDRGRLISVLSDLTGEVRGRIESAYNPQSSITAVEEAHANCRQLLRQLRIPRRRILGVGLVMPGPFGVRRVEAASLPGWNALGVKQELEKRLRLPVLLENDATAAAVGEWLFGAASGTRNFCFLYLGIGLGAGIVVNNQKYSGTLGNAGELGHVIVRPGGRLCACGNRGCLEPYLSLGSAIEAFSRKGRKMATVAEFCDLVEPTDPVIRKWIRDAAYPLRLGIQAMENLFDPETIVVGGDAPSWLTRALIKAAAPLHASVRETRGSSRARLVESIVGADAAARGAAVLPVFEALNPQQSSHTNVPAKPQPADRLELSFVSHGLESGAGNEAKARTAFETRPHFAPKGGS